MLLPRWFQCRRNTMPRPCQFVMLPRRIKLPRQWVMLGLKEFYPTNRSPNLAAVTAGVGVPLGIAWLVTLVFLYRHRRKIRLLEQEKSQWMRDYQLAKWRRNSHGVGGGSTKLPENQEPSELAAVSSPHEMQG